MATLCVINVSGVTFKADVINRYLPIITLGKKDEIKVKVEHEPSNKYDDQAMAVSIAHDSVDNGVYNKIGYIGKDYNQHFKAYYENDMIKNIRVKDLGRVVKSSEVITFVSLNFDFIDS